MLAPSTAHRHANGRDRLTRLERRLGYTFSDRELLERALSRRGRSRRANQRLEFLGDAVLDLVVGQALYERFADASEAELTIARSELVRGRTLAELARGIGLERFIRLAEGERAAGSELRDSILADTLEALFGAVYLDGGLEAARGVIDKTLAKRLAHMNGAPAKDPKSRLQELLQARAQPLPRYAIVDEAGPPHERVFLVSAHLDSERLTAFGRGDSRRGAEQRAAARLLRALEGGS